VPTDLAMQCRVPPGDTSQLTTGIGSFLSTPLRETSGTALTEPRAHSRIHCIARSVICLSFHHFRLGGMLEFSHNQQR
ncbi:hypothetical protein LSI99_26785, partial [Klebsiella quasipneumoniae subsp. similipneumoniae]|uniref:hypothetical protein n=1 Tax=Klebsiella pneumoniae complex TaxID=3390273 RepID=UPI001E5509A9